MAVLPVLTYPDPRLKEVSKPVDGVDQDILTLFDDMYETMIAEDGCGIAAPQVGVLKRMAIVDFKYKDPAFETLFMINPEVIWYGDETQTIEEGCLSVEGGRSSVTRPAHIKVRYMDRESVIQEIDVDGMTACAIQHEIDHLDGILFIDHLSRLRRQMFLKKAQRHPTERPRTRS